MGSLPIQTIQFLAPMQFEAFPIYIKLDQCKLLEVSQIKLFLFTRLCCLVDAKIYKRNEQTASFFKEYSFIASKSTFEFISRYKDVQESHLKQNSFLSKHRLPGLMGHLYHQLIRPEMDQKLRKS